MRYLGRSIIASTFFVLASVVAPASAAPLSSPQAFTVTAYCQDGVTKSGLPTQPGVAAADPGYLPMGTLVRVHGGEPPEARVDDGRSAETRPSAGGVYTVLDTGSKVNGRHLDLFMNDCNRAIRFGRRLLRVTILRLGWRSHLPVPHRP
jgi:3D (Asp-Asp-Asp) domain-containing protein